MEIINRISVKNVRIFMFNAHYSIFVYLLYLDYINNQLYKIEHKILSCDRIIIHGYSQML